MTKISPRKVAQATRRRPPAIFIADAPGLDFLNSIATPTDTPIDWIGNGDGLLDWLAQARLVPVKVLKAVRAQALPEELDSAAAQALRLPGMFRAFIRRPAGLPL